MQELTEVAVEEDDDAKLQRFLLQVEAESHAVQVGAESQAVQVLPTRVVVLRNVFDPKDAATDIGIVEADIGSECSNAGLITALHLNATDGAAVIEFENIQCAERCVEVMHGR